VQTYVGAEAPANADSRKPDQFYERSRLLAGRGHRAARIEKTSLAGISCASHARSGVDVRQLGTAYSGANHTNAIQGDRHDSSRTDESAASANFTCPYGSTNITGVVTRNYAGRGFAGCFSSGKRSTDGFAKIVAAFLSGIFGLVATALRAVLPYVHKASAEMGRPQAGWLQLQRN